MNKVMNSTRPSLLVITLALIVTASPLGSALGKTSKKAKAKPSQSEALRSGPNSSLKAKPKSGSTPEENLPTEKPASKPKTKIKKKKSSGPEKESSPKTATFAPGSTPPSAKRFEPTDIMEADQREIGRNRYGIVGGYLNNDMQATFSYGGKNQTADMKGKGFGLSGYFEHQFSGPFFGRALAGIEQYQASVLQASTVCDGGKTNLCSMELVNLAMQAQAKIAVMASRVPLWVGGGLGFWVPLTKKSTVFDTSSIGPLLVYVLSAGIDIPIFGQRFPFFVDYVVLSGGATLSGDSLILRLGYSWDY